MLLEVPDGLTQAFQGAIRGLLGERDRWFRFNYPIVWVGQA